MFENISIIGRALYIAKIIERFLTERGYNLEDFRTMFDAIYSYENFEFVDAYCDNLLECNPDCVLDERDNFDDCEYIKSEDLFKFRQVLKNMKPDDLEILIYLGNSMEEIIAHNLYTGITPPEPYSLSILTKDVIPFMQDKILAMPEFEFDNKFSIYDQWGWGNYDK